MIICGLVALLNVTSQKIKRGLSPFYNEMQADENCGILGLMDNIDKQIISLLQANARMPISEIGNTVGRSRTVVGKRIDQLLADGEIVQFTIKVKEQPTKPISVLFKVKNAQGYSCHQVVPAFQQAYPIVQALSISGEEWDVLIQAEFANSDELNEAKNFLDTMEGVSSAVTHLILHKFG